VERDIYLEGRGFGHGRDVISPADEIGPDGF
jgi:hypothetical protein